jgi:hypothetical protein
VGDVCGDAGGARDIIQGQLGHEGVLPVDGRGARVTGKGEREGEGATERKTEMVSGSERGREGGGDEASCTMTSRSGPALERKSRCATSTARPCDPEKSERGERKKARSHHLHQQAAGLADATGGAEDGHLVSAGLLGLHQTLAHGAGGGGEHVGSGLRGRLRGGGARGCAGERESRRLRQPF